ncbi:MAG: hypothetical protein HY821_00420 [Acidobacteria bacterium]|nr:hypothetical protein [Acidobacteriota bacterium]
MPEFNSKLSRSEQARLNGSKSRGPKTASGKQNSSQNARKHDFFTQTALLYFESPDEFTELRDDYVAEYNPQGPTEMHFIMEMANAQHRLRRVRGMEADLVQKLIVHDLGSPGLGNFELQAEAVRTLSDKSTVLPLLQRYETMFRRQYERALHLLWEHRDRAAARQKQQAAQAQQQAAAETRAAINTIHAMIAGPLQNEPNFPPPRQLAAHPRPLIRTKRPLDRTREPL